MNRPRCHLVRLVAGGCLALLNVVAASETNLFTRYQVIIDRAPFGTISGGGEAGPLPNFAERYTFAGLVPSATSNQLLAVIFDSARNRADLVLAGDTVGEVTVEQIDVADQGSKVIIRKGLERATLPLKTRDTAIAGVPSGPAAALIVKPGGPVTPNQVTPGQTPNGENRTVVMPARRRIPFRRGE